MAFQSAKTSTHAMNTCNVFETYSVNSVPKVPAQLELQVSTSTTQCTVHWHQNNQTEYFNCHVNVSIYIADLQVISDQQWMNVAGCAKTETLHFSSLKYTWSTVPGL
uniref:Fibronectin type-III domain-containing protein n=1 Tax=Panagrellus redivivus TaxID=6233 RepID=A0A7E4ZRW6_PANRE